ncbi:MULTISPECIES: type 1 glutamine amidotransferase domain-containing protein [Halolamina]|uniref:Putative intracellular protease/amidase n=1 Tax=Halolamina pelagica TaxID=699431 RepID=A0A1I5VI82_9EURY|nr:MULTISPECIES: type 1 glutamine amidotransferase domain-containing protein [Halolamina]NHX37657.1 type 1 glutamine amidotransferase domain-containing protein [Halolamina sp. R1-12]SFQ07200.1 Putative intracellular protease/amidase [Halolamina pelagica]
MTDALFIVSEEGYWAEECIDPLTTLTDAGVEITVATPTGNPPVVDERSLDPEDIGEAEADRLREIHETDDRLNDPTPLAAAEPGSYDAVVFPGGHGAEWDITQDSHARAALRTAVEGEDGTALVVCHTVGILAFARDSAGELLVEGRDVTGFPNAWEEGIVDENDLMPDGRKLPYWVEDEVTAAGGNWDAELDSDTSVTVDGDLVTARGPGSSHAAALTLLEELGVDA